MKTFIAAVYRHRRRDSHRYGAGLSAGCADCLAPKRAMRILFFSVSSTVSPLGGASSQEPNISEQCSGTWSRGTGGCQPCGRTLLGPRSLVLLRGVVLDISQKCYRVLLVILHDTPSSACGPL